MNILPTEETIIKNDSDTNELEKSDDQSFVYDPLKMNIGIREDPQSVFQLVRKYGKGDLVIDPDFQRNLVWKPKQKSRFIESILLNFPIPPLYVNEQVNGKWVIIDGLQRTSTLINFLNEENGFVLEGLKPLANLNGKKFKELDSAYQAKIEDKKLTIYILQAETPTEVIYELFDRINTGGTPLNRQEVRHCIFKGKSTELLKELAGKEYFQKAVDKGVSSERMKDREIVLRYLAFKVLGYESYDRDLSSFVEKAMVRINKMQDSEIELLRKDFERVMLMTFDFFGKNNFRYRRKEEGIVKSRGMINIALLESICLFFSTYSDDFLLTHKAKVINNFEVLLDDPLYDDSVRLSTGTRHRVINRFSIAQKILSKV